MQAPPGRRRRAADVTSPWRVRHARRWRACPPPAAGRDPPPWPLGGTRTRSLTASERLVARESSALAPSPRRRHRQLRAALAIAATRADPAPRARARLGDGVATFGPPGVAIAVGRTPRRDHVTPPDSRDRPYTSGAPRTVRRGGSRRRRPATAVRRRRMQSGAGARHAESHREQIHYRLSSQSAVNGASTCSCARLTSASSIRAKALGHPEIDVGIFQLCSSG